MRRRLAAIATGVALVLGTAGALTPADSAVLCPPGCVAIGSIRVLGSGFPGPDQLYMVGSVTMVATTRTGVIANAASVLQNYYFYAYGPVSTGPSGFLRGSVQVELYTGESGAYGSSDYISGTVSVQGKPSALRLSNSKLNIALVNVGGNLQGTVVSYG
ncbi:MAG: hypothetical protein JWN31_658 [Frankiales bacterium]|nr:hypothetical protein [Frankiales bacterium]